MFSNKKYLVLIAFLSFFTISVLQPTKISAELLINEFNAKGSPEWVEILNTDEDPTNLGDYYFDDDSNFSVDDLSSDKIQLAGILQSNAMCYLDMQGHYLNDDGDSPTIFAWNGDASDTYTYATTSAGLSYSRIPDGGAWQVNTPFSKTTVACSSLPTPTPTQTSTPTTAPTTTSTPTIAPTRTPTIRPLATPTRSPTPKASATASASPTSTPEPTDESPVIAESVPTTTPKGLVAGASTTKKSVPAVANIFIYSGAALMVVGGIGLYIKNKKQYNSDQ